MKPMQSLAEFPLDMARRVRYVLTDIDDTLTTDGELTAPAYSALERLREAGLIVVPITGRPAGWCDMIARFWPVHGVVGENGALYFAYDRSARRMERRYVRSLAQRVQDRERLNQLAQDILRTVPGSAVATDQAYREADLAIDFCEDVPALDRASVDAIVQAFERVGAMAKVSSIHVNGWFGEYDKLSMTRQFFREVLQQELEAVKDQVVFCGDSPNDAPMFAYFPLSFGVANVKDFAQSMPALPRWVADGLGGTGFVEIANRLLAERSKPPG